MNKLVRKFDPGGSISSSTNSGANGTGLIGNTAFGSTGVRGFINQQANGYLGNQMQGLSGSALFQTIGGNMQTSGNGAVRGLGSIIANGGSQVASSFTKPFVDSALKSGLSGFTKSGISGLAKNGLSNVKGMFSGVGGASFGMGLAGAALSAIAGPKREYAGEKGSLTQGLDTAYDAIATGVQVIPGVGQIIGGAMALGKGVGAVLNKFGGGTDAMTNTDAILGSSFLNLTPIGIINGFGGKTSKTMGGKDFMTQNQLNNVWSGYNGTRAQYDTALTKENKKYGLFSSGARKRANKLIDKANMDRESLLDMNRMTELGDIKGNNMAGINTTQYAQDLQGGPNFNNLRVGRIGLKLPNKRELLQVRYLASKVNTRIQNITEFVPVEQEIPEHKEGGIIAANLDWKFDIQRFQKGGSVNIIPEGALHARKHNMDIDNVTKKGIPVVDNNGQQQAEIEKNEIIFRKEVTDKLEQLAKDGSEQAAIEAGELLVKEIFENTDDKTGLIEEVTGVTKEQRELNNHEIFPVDKKQHGGQINKPKYLDWLKTVPKDRLSPNYDLEEAYNHLPFKELESWRRASDVDLQQGKFHLRSIYELPNGEYKFLKLGKEDTNPEVKLETDMYRNNETGLENTHDLVYDGDRYYYRFKKNLPKREDGGMIEKGEQGLTVNSQQKPMKPVMNPPAGFIWKFNEQTNSWEQVADSSTLPKLDSSTLPNLNNIPISGGGKAANIAGMAQTFTQGIINGINVYKQGKEARKLQQQQQEEATRQQQLESSQIVQDKQYARQVSDALSQSYLQKQHDNSIYGNQQPLRAEEGGTLTQNLTKEELETLKSLLQKLK